MNGQAKISVMIPESFYIHTDLCQRLDREVSGIATGLRIVYLPDAAADARIKIQYHNSSDCHFVEDIITPERFACYCQQINVVRLLRELCGAQNAVAVNEAVLSALETWLTGECVQLWHSSILPADREQASAYLIQYFDVKRLLTALAKRYWDTPDEIAQKFGKLKATPLKEKKVQTIGIFNYQMWNGGTDRVISILAPMYEEMGYRVVVITMAGPTPKDFPLSPGIPHLQITGDWETHSGNLGARLEQWDKLINEYSIDLIIYHPWTFRLLVWDVLFLKLRGVSVVFHIHSIFSFLLAEGKIEFSLLPNRLLLGDGIVVISKTDRIFWGCFHENVHHIPNPVAPELMQAKQSSGEGGKIVWIERLAPEKRPMDAIQIMEHVARRSPNAVLYIIGGGNQVFTEQCRNAVQEKGLEHNVVFLGFQKDVYQYLETATVHVITSLHEGFSMSLLEAMAHGVPTVMYEMPYLDLYQARAKYGILGIEEANYKQAAAEICRLLEDRSAWEQASRAAVKVFEGMARYDYRGAWQRLFSGEISPCISTEEEKVMMQAVVDHYLAGWKQEYLVQPMDKLFPAFSDNNIAIAFCADDNFAPCTAVMIRSILANGSRSNNYDFVLFHSGMSVDNQQKLTKMVGKYSNASMRFVNVVKFISQYQFYTGTVSADKKISKETYYRLLIPEIMSEYKKVLYLDGDMTALSDVAEVYGTELGDNLAAVCRDIVGMMDYYNPDCIVDRQTGETTKEYWDIELGLKDATRHFNAGLILFNIPAFRAAYSTEFLLEYAVSRSWKCHDQDILNVLCEDRVIIIESSWNSINGDPRFLPDSLRAEFQECLDHPKIAHFAGPYKPWLVPNARFQKYFWPYAADTPYLETLLRQLITRNTGSGGLDARATIETQFRHGQAGMRYLLRLGKLWLAYKLKGEAK